ncbi:Ldh family oxidoreductase [Streptomyces paludis]|uniref:Ldh family oxidoreductase n=1 Tax=Streptomyces paludis TaxID=2282738 RepID=UPI0013B432FF|nr:Ldh family oxidoreductase [Streptomyces paludis]
MRLQERVTSVLQHLGADADIAAEVARHLLRAEASGHASHGILRLPQYQDEIARGIIDPSARPEVTRDEGVALLIDARRGFGHYSTSVATDLLARRALEHGMAMASIRNTTHIGRLGEYTERLNAQGLLSIITVGAAGPGIGSMAPFGTRSGPFLNSNPFAIGVPGKGQDFVFDGSMSNIAEGKVHAARDRRSGLPEGAILDRDGRPTTDPGDFYAGGTLTPLGGSLAGHKGYGLALAAALLGGLAHADGSPADVTGIAATSGAREGSPRIGGVTLLAFDPRRFGSEDGSYQSGVGSVLQALTGAGAVVPGEFEARKRANARETEPEPRAEETLALLESQFAKAVER